MISCQSLGHNKAKDGTYPPWRQFNGYQYMVDNGATLNVDFVLQIGDYIYADHTIGDADYQGPCQTVDDYRLRYGKYRMSRDSLREIHRLKPFYASPDDHEFWNNVLGGERDYAAGTVDGNAVSRFNAAMRAYWENMPLRYRPDYDTATGLRFGYFTRDPQWGTALRLSLLDSRQFHTASGTGPAVTALGIDPYPDHSHHPRQDLLDTIYNSTTTWTCIASQVPMGIVDGIDTWAGYPDERNLITDQLAKARANGTIPNAVVVSGDIHVGVVGQLANKDNTAYVATEFVGPPMTSGDTSGVTVNGGSHLEVMKTSAGYTQHGFMLCEVTPDHFDASYYVGSPTEPAGDVLSSTAPVSKFCTWRRVPGTVTPTPTLNAESRCCREETRDR